MTKLSVNINKVATLRNARGGNLPDVLRFALDCEAFGAEGITVHPRPDGRHIRYSDVRALTPLLKTEFNIEGNPTADFMDLVFEQSPAQVTLVPDKEDALTSNAGWNTVEQFDFLKSIVTELREKGIRSSIFVDPNIEMIQKAKELGADRVELYTEEYASEYAADKVAAIRPYREAALYAKEIGLELNAGHDLNLDNLRYFVESIPFIAEVSIGHALISDALYYGIENTIQMYLNQLKY